MIKLIKTVSAWGGDSCLQVLKSEIRALAIEQLPLQRALVAGHHVNDEAFDVMIIHSSEDAQRINAKVGVFFQGIISGCSCADDPSPENTTTEYAVLRFIIDKESAEADVLLLTE